MPRRGSLNRLTPVCTQPTPGLTGIILYAFPGAWLVPPIRDIVLLTKGFCR